MPVNSRSASVRATWSISSQCSNVPRSASGWLRMSPYRLNGCWVCGGVPRALYMIGSSPVDSICSRTLPPMPQVLMRCPRRRTSSRLTVPSCVVGSGMRCRGCHRQVARSGRVQPGCGGMRRRSSTGERVGRVVGRSGSAWPAVDGSARRRIVRSDPAPSTTEQRRLRGQERQARTRVRGGSSPAPVARPATPRAPRRPSRAGACFWTLPEPVSGKASTKRM